MRSLDKLLTAFDNIALDESIMRSQLDRMRERTSAGVDIDGKPFAPYSRPNRDGRLVPLGAGAKLIDRARIDAAPSFTGVDLAATITGRAGGISVYQNRMRHFIGYSQNDRENVMEDVKESIARGLK